jgi:hypothetical protein
VIRNRFSLSLAALCATGLLLFSTACTPSNTTVVAIKGVEVAIATAIPILAGTGVVPAPLVPVVEMYLSNASQATNETITELESPDTTARKWQVIAADWASVVIPNLAGTGISQTGLTAIQAVNAAIQSFLSLINPPAGTIAAHTLAQAKAHNSFQLTFSDRRTLHGVQKDAQNLTKLLAAHPFGK